MVTLPDIGAIRDRFDVYRRFNGQVANVRETSDARATRPPIVKTFLLEHVRPTAERPATDPAEILRSLQLEAVPVDDSFLAVIGPSESAVGPGVQSRRKVLGYLETYDPRFFAFYTTEKSQDAERLVRQWLSSPELDFCWFNSRLLQRFWEQDVSQRGDTRYSKLVFKHKSIFEMPAGTAENGDEGAEQDDNPERDDRPEPDRRNARFEMGDRIGEIRRSLAKLQRHYSPLHALYSLRFPSRVGRGGHDLYQNGRVTNWAESFEEHRNVVRYFWRCYRDVLTATEQAAWENREGGALGSRQDGRGVPLIVRFREELPKETFDRWVSCAFRKNNLFRLWGQPIRLGPRKVHVYGADRHLWQPLNIEMTASGVTAILPQETCGNTFHRLVTNIQHYVCPDIEAWLGAREFSSLASFGQEREEGE